MAVTGGGNGLWGGVTFDNWGEGGLPQEVLGRSAGDGSMIAKRTSDFLGRIFFGFYTM